MDFVKDDDGDFGDIVVEEIVAVLHQFRRGHEHVWKGGEIITVSQFMLCQRGLLIGGRALAGFTKWIEKFVVLQQKWS